MTASFLGGLQFILKVIIAVLWLVRWTQLDRAARAPAVGTCIWHVLVQDTFLSHSLPLPPPPPSPAPWDAFFPQASLEFESKMALAQLKCARSLNTRALLATIIQMTQLSYQNMRKLASVSPV